MTEMYVIAGLVIFMAVRECYYIYATHKLINKVMSKNYAEYVQTEMLKKHKPAVPMTMDDAANVEMDQQFGVLSGIS